MIPLSTRMRPGSIDEFVGQEHFLYKNSLFYNAVKNKTFNSGLFFGPSGSGKTTLARIIAKEMDSNFVEINSTTSGVKELKDIIKAAKDSFYGIEGKTTYLYVDEIHRWNKLQQDTLLQALEEGIIKFIGSTTENPYFSVNNAILSRVGNVYEFKKLSDDNVFLLLKRALNDKERGLGTLNINYDEESIWTLAKMAGGDGRVALDALGFIVANLSKVKSIDENIVQEAMQKKADFFHKEEDGYDLYSALQKSVRGSDPDASIHYLVRMIEGGMDVMAIGRRLMVMASEDVGMAYPQAISIVTSCVQAAHMIGFPEAEIPLAQAVITMAASPKSNSSISALYSAKADLRNMDTGEIPLHLKDSHYSGAEKRGIGLDYKYPHDYGGWVEQQYLPDNLYKINKKYYIPKDKGAEIRFKQYLDTIENLKNKK